MRSGTLNTILLLLTAGVLFTSCSDSGTNAEVELTVETAEDVPADVDGEHGSPPDYTLYSLSSGEIVADSDSASTEWDLGFSATTIIINGGTSGPGEGGAVVLDIPFDQVDTAPSQGYAADTETSFAIPTGSGNGWYNYTGETEPRNAILPIPDRTLVIRTATGNYARIEILSYYEGNPDTSTEDFAGMQTRPPSRYYTFRYVLQPDGSTELE